MELDDYDIHCAKLFEEGIISQHHGDTSILSLSNKSDCFILDIPKKAEQQFRKNFLLKANERILLARDTSAWNQRDEGLVLTDRRIVYVPQHYSDNQCLYIVKLGAFIHVTHNADAVLFWNTEDSFFAIPKNYFFKKRWKSYDFDRAIHQLSDILDQMSNKSPLDNIDNRYPHGQIIPIVYNLHKYAEV